MSETIHEPSRKAIKTDTMMKELKEKIDILIFALCATSETGTRSGSESRAHEQVV